MKSHVYVAMKKDIIRNPSQPPLVFYRVSTRAGKAGNAGKAGKMAFLKFRAGKAGKRCN